jgi:hypothetical protein
MKANELRIGNWVMIDPSDIPQQVCDVMCDSVNTENIQGAHYGLVGAITLTEEWLLKFGFEKDVTEYNTCWFLNHVYIWFVDGEYINELDLPIKYVHQLQNLYFALKGEELTLKEDK